MITIVSDHQNPQGNYSDINKVVSQNNSPKLALDDPVNYQLIHVPK